MVQTNTQFNNVVSDLIEVEKLKADNVRAIKKGPAVYSCYSSGVVGTAVNMVPTTLFVAGRVFYIDTIIMNGNNARDQFVCDCATTPANILSGTLLAYDRVAAAGTQVYQLGGAPCVSGVWFVPDNSGNAMSCIIVGRWA